MADWIRFEEVTCFARPAVVSFRDVPTRESPVYEFNPPESFVSEKQQADDVGILWHFGGPTGGHEPLIIECVSDPVALAVQATSDARAILDVFTVDRERNLWHRRFSPPPRSFLPLARRGCLWATFDSIFGRTPVPDARRTGWHALGRCDSTPAACSKMDGALAVVVRRGEQLFYRRFLQGRRAWDSEILIAAARSAVDPVAVWDSSVVKLFTITSAGELFMYSLDHPEAEGIWLGDNLALFSPAIAHERVFALSRTGELLHRHPDADDWRVVGNDPARRWTSAPVAWFFQRADPAMARGFFPSLQTLVFVRDGIGNLWTTKLALGGSEWIPWENLEGAETREFSVVQITGGFALYARGRDNHLWKVAW